VITVVNRSAPTRGYAFAAVSVLLWGTSFVATKVALRTVSPLGIVAGRAVLGWFLLAGFVLARREVSHDRPESGDRLRIALLGVLGLPVHLALQASALTLTSATHSGWLIALNPVFTVVLAAIFLGESFSRVKLAGTMLGLAGALTIVAGGAGVNALRLPSTGGDLLILASSLNWAVYTLIARGLMLRRAPANVTFRAVSVGATGALALYALGGAPSEITRWTAEGWLALGFLGLGCTGLGYLAWSAALECLEASRLTSFQFVQPLVTAIAAAIWIREPLSAIVWAGGGLVLLGVALVQRSAVSKSAPAPTS
jgi:drug/metabolite transporter (DMT)-like permease